MNMDIQGLDVEAWERWVAYRKAIKKPLKEASLHAAKLKLARYGSQQAEVVEQSVANQWQGLFDLKIAKPAPGEKPKKTREQIEASDAAFQSMKDHAVHGWADQISDPIGRLKLCEALWSRYTVEPTIDQDDRMDWLKGVIALHLREANPRKVLNEPGLHTMVWCFFGEAGAKRLKKLALEQAQ